MDKIKASYQGILNNSKSFLPEKVLKITKVILPSIVIIFALYFLLKGLQILSNVPFATNTSWTSTKASYLASRVYLNPTNSDIQALTQAGSAQNAVNLIFTTPSQQEQEQYNQGLQSLESKKNSYKTQVAYEDTLYAYQMVHDPNRVQCKLYYLWENVFSVDAPEKGKMITLDDAKILHQMLYDNALGNYIDIVKNVENNYAMAQYLDLTASTAKNPNENFARELMQLFLIGQYTPLDHNKTTPNYSDQDVNSLAYILTGFTADKLNHIVSYNGKRHFVPDKPFLGQEYNNPQGAIDFIVQQRKTQAGEFLANKLLHYYVTDNPTDADITAFSNVIIQNNFELLPSIKWLFASNIMYEPQYMSADRFKTPMDLVSSYYTLLWGMNNYNVIPNSQELTDLDFRPYSPGSIFGRPGFNTNILFYSGTIMNRWIADTDALLHKMSSADISAVFSHLISNPNSIHTPSDLINVLSMQLYLGKTLPPSVQQSLQKYLTTSDANKPVTFNINDPKYLQSKLPGLLSLMFIQPEFLAQSGDTQAIAFVPITQINGGTQSKLIVVRVRGGWDFQGIWANTTDPAYNSNRKQMALNSSNATSLGNGYMLNNAASSILPLLKSKEAFLVSSVGLPNHSRAHDIAGIQMETGDNQNQTGILGQLTKAEPATSLITLTNTAPVMTNGAPSLQIGSANLTLYPVVKRKSIYSQDITVRENYLKQILNSRSFPKTLAVYYTQALLLDKLAKEDISQGGKGTPGGTNATQTPFLEKLITNNIGNTYYLYADGTYDHHAHEDLLLNKQVSDLFTNFTNFYNTEKSKTKLTIVFFSEFGRTDKINGSNGTDHGQGGGMVILSNELNLPEMTGTITPSKDSHNWTTVQVDERDVWATIFNQIYNLPQKHTAADNFVYE